MEEILHEQEYQFEDVTIINCTTASHALVHFLFRRSFYLLVSSFFIAFSCNINLRANMKGSINTLPAVDTKLMCPEPQ